MFCTYWFIYNDKHVFIENLRAEFGMGAVRYQGSHTLYMLLKIQLCNSTFVTINNFKDIGCLSVYETQIK
jgi:hypothetical protein